ncbi:MAG: hypothetical protein ACK559_13020, partial [bacterium]
RLPEAGHLLLEVFLERRSLLELVFGPEVLLIHLLQGLRWSAASRSRYLRCPSTADRFSGHSCHTSYRRWGFCPFCLLRASQGSSWCLWQTGFLRFSWYGSFVRLGRHHCFR